MPRIITTLALLASLTASPLQAGTISLGSSLSTIRLGRTFEESQPAIVGVSIDTTNPMPPDGPDRLEALSIAMTFTGPGSGIAGPFEIAGGVPDASFENAQADGSVHIVFGFNSLSSFSGGLFSFEFLATAPGTYTVAASSGFEANVVVYGLGNGRDDLPFETDVLTPTAFATIVALPFPEPGSLALAGVCLAGLAARALPRKRLTNPSRGDCRRPD